MTDRLEALERLGRLRDLNVLTGEEFDREKARLLTPTGASEPDKKHDNKAESPTSAVASDEGVAIDQEQSASVVESLPTPSRTRIYIASGAILLVAAIGSGIYFSAEMMPKKSDQHSSAEEGGPVADTPSNELRLSSILEFENPAECTPSDELHTLIGDLSVLDASAEVSEVGLGVDGPAINPTVIRTDQGGGATIARVATSSSWEGLRVTELRTTRFDASGVESFQIRFGEDVGRVRDRLNRIGFELAEVGELKTVEQSDGTSLVYGVDRTERGAMLLCSRL